MRDGLSSPALFIIPHRPVRICPAAPAKKRHATAESKSISHTPLYATRKTLLRGSSSLQWRQNHLPDPVRSGHCSLRIVWRGRISGKEDGRMDCKTQSLRGERLHPPVLRMHDEPLPQSVWSAGKAAAPRSWRGLMAPYPGALAPTDPMGYLPVGANAAWTDADLVPEAGKGRILAVPA